MKVETILSFIKLPEGVDFDLSQLDLKPLEDEWNRQYNGMKKSYGEEVTQKAVSDLLSKYGLENEESIKALQDSVKSEEQNQNTELTTIKTELENLKSTLAEKDAKLLDGERMSILQGLKVNESSIRQDRLDKAHKLILSELGEEDSYEEKAKAFLEATPEWLSGTKKATVTLDDTDPTDPPGKDEDVVALENAWG